MKFKTMIACAIMACASSLTAIADVIPGTITTTWTQTVYTNYVQVNAPFSVVPIGGTPVYKALEKIVLKNNTASSASMAVAMADIDDWTTLTGSPIVAATTAQTVAYPWRGVTETQAGYVVTNDVLVASTTTVTKYVPYNVNRLRLITTLNSTNYPSTLKFTVQVQ